MSMNSLNTRNSRGAWQSISTIASELSRDIREIYPQAKLALQSISIRSNAPAIYEQIDLCLGGELIVLATGDSKAREEFCHEVVHHAALRNNQPIAFFCLAVPYLRFARKLFGDLSEIPPEAGIYDGLLDEAELRKLASTLERLGSSDIYFNTIREITIDQLCEAARLQFRDAGSMRLILVDNVQSIWGCRYGQDELGKHLVKLRLLSKGLNVPIVALYQLEPMVEHLPATVTSNVLREIEAVARLTDKVLLLDKVAGEFVLANPKIPISV